MVEEGEMTCGRKIGPYDCCTVVCGDCLELMKAIPDGAVDAVITDPPYGNDHPTNYAERGRGILANTRDFARVYGNDCKFDASFLISPLPTILWGANFYADTLPATGGWLVWDKRVQQDVGVNDQADGELAWTNCVKGVRIFRHMWNGFWRDSERGESYHPTQKPVALMEWCIGLRWIPDGLILDPFCGSGTTLVAAKKLGRHFLGFEISPEYCEIARDRLARIDAQPSLFQPVPEQLKL